MRIKSFILILFLSLIECSFISKTGEFITSIDFQQRYAEIKPELNISNEIKKILITYPSAGIDIMRRYPHIVQLFYHDVIRVFYLTDKFKIYTSFPPDVTEKKVIYPMSSEYSFYYWFFGNPSSVEFIYNHKLPEEQVDITVEFNIRNFRKGFSMKSSWIELDIEIRGKNNILLYSGKLKGFYRDVLKLLEREVK